MDTIICEQGTQEWLDARRCMLTGTKQDSVMGTEWEQLMLACELIAEEVTEQVKTHTSTREMERGTEEEVFARKHYQKKTGNELTQIGFCRSKEFPFVGHSGDGWVEMVDNPGVYVGAFENKSPDSKNSVFYRLEHELGAEALNLGSMSAVTKNNPVSVFKPSAKAPFMGAPAQYKWQLVNYFLVNPDLQWLDFSVYDSRFVVDDDKMHIVHIERSSPEMQQALSDLREGVVAFREFWMKLRAVIIKDNF